MADFIFFPLLGKRKYLLGNNNAPTHVAERNTCNLFFFLLPRTSFMENVQVFSLSFKLSDIHMSYNYNKNKKQRKTPHLLSQ